MRLFIRNSDRVLADLIHRRFTFALGRFDGRIHSVTVRILDVNGPRGGIDKQGRVTVRVRGDAWPIVIENIDADAAVAIDRLADRTARAVARAVRTLRDWPSRDRRLQEAW
jgi:hypothetical protein